MLVYHGSTNRQCSEFVEKGIDANLLFPRNIHGAQDFVPGLFVTPDLEVAKRFGPCVISIMVQSSDLHCPPIMAQHGISLIEALENPI